MISPLKKRYLRSIYFKNNPTKRKLYTNKTLFYSISEDFPITAECRNSDGFEGYQNTEDLNTMSNSFSVGVYDYGECAPIINMEAPGIFNQDLNEVALTNNFAFDPIVGTNLSQVQSGEHALRINSPQCNPYGRAVTFRKTFTSNDQAQTYTFSYAMVAEHPSLAHTDEKPIFQVKAINSSGEELDEFCVVTNPDNNPFFNVIGESEDPCPSGIENKTVWTDWNCQSLEVIGDFGEEITLEFTATGCGQTAHFGYVYIDSISNCDDCGETTTGNIVLPEFSPCEVLPSEFAVEHTPPIWNHEDGTTETGIISSAELIILQNDTPVGPAINVYNIIGDEIVFNINASNLNGFTGGFDFEVQVDYAINNGIHTVMEKHTIPGEDNDFFYEIGNCCENFDNASFSVALNLSNEIYVGNYDTYSSQNAIHEWYVLSSSNQYDGPYTPENSLIGSNGNDIVLTNPVDGLYYTVIHKVISDCGEVCSSEVIYINNGSFSPIAQIDSASIDCCILYEYWPNGPGSEGTELNALFNASIIYTSGEPDMIEASSVIDYSSNANINQQWIFYSSPNPDNGPFTIEDIGYGPTYNSPNIEESLYYFLVKKVSIESCGIEVCKGVRVQIVNGSRMMSSSWDLVDCGDLPECAELEAPTNFVENTISDPKGGGTGTITWDAVPGAIEYFVSAVNTTYSGDFGFMQYDEYTTPNTYHSLGLSVDKSCITVRAVCADGSLSPASQTVCLDLGPSNIMAVETMVGNINPNPSNGNFSVELESPYSSKITLSLRNFQGIAIDIKKGEVKAEVEKTFHWEKTGLSPGLYFIIIETNKEQKTLKLVIE